MVNKNNGWPKRATENIWWKIGEKREAQARKSFQKSLEAVP